MKNIFLSALLFLSCVQPVMAQDKDDELKPDETKRLDTADEPGVGIEQTDPEAAAEVRKFLIEHIAHANQKDIEAYMGDFDLSQQKQPEHLREYSERAMALPNLKIEILAIEFAKLQKQAATVHTRQRSSYTNAQGVTVIDDVILSYRFVRNDQNAWKILFTERRRLSAP